MSRITALPYTVIVEHINNHTIWPPKQWCYGQFGPRWGLVESKNESRSGTWTVLWIGHDSRGQLSRNYRWHFAREQDAMLFQLRWS